MHTSLYTVLQTIIEIIVMYTIIHDQRMIKKITNY